MVEEIVYDNGSTYVQRVKDSRLYQETITEPEEMTERNFWHRFMKELKPELDEIARQEAESVKWARDKLIM